ncbi:hypothetical protein H2201_009217, partial [Coniosporium apollinis]
YKSFMETIHLRPATPLPLHDNSSPTTNKHFIVFKHPGYPEDYEQNVLLQLYAWDSPNGGLHAGTALLACSLIACNAWDGYLTVERDGQKLDLQDDDILSAPEYYFHVPEPPTASADSTSSRNHYKYPIYPSFQHWAFPHRHVPSQWRGASGDEGGSVPDEPSSTPSVSSVSAAVIARDRACAISKHRDYIERAHLCPRNELDWFQKNGMRRYNARLDISGDVITDDMANALAMRADIHRAFDGCKFAFVRKAGRWVAHFLETTYELGRMYHNRPVEMAAGVAPEFVLARFAWLVFPLVKAFMEHGPERLVRVREVCEGGLREVVKTLDPVGFAQITGTTRGRSASPKKRKASETLPPIVEAKRLCGSSHHQAQQTLDTSEEGSKHADDQGTPSLSSDNGTYLQPHLIAAPLDPLPPRPPSGSDLEANRLSFLRMRELRKRRPRNRALLCCDYSLAERANALGIPGKPEYGGGHLCNECLGLESGPYWDEGDGTEELIWENG